MVAWAGSGWCKSMPFFYHYFCFACLFVLPTPPTPASGGEMIEGF